MPPRSHFVETFMRGFFAVLTVFYGALLLLLAFGLMFIYSTAKAAGAIPVPPQCVELAQREGYPTDFLTKTQAARARLRMARLSDRDPVVKACRDAVRAERAAGAPP